MFRPRVIPCLLLRNKGLVKTVKFKKPIYVGDPINAVKIFNDKDADELILLDITVSTGNGSISYDLIKDVGDEANMPFSVGGGLRSIEQIKKIFNNGAEKVCINTTAFENPTFIREAAEHFGSQSIVVSIDAKRKLFGKYEVYIRSGTKSTGLDPVTHAIRMEEMGAGEIMINSIDRDGCMDGYDIELTRMVSDAVRIPVIACGGAGKIQNFIAPVSEGKASAVAAGSMFVFYGSRRSVLINYPEQNKLREIFSFIKN